MHSRVRVAAIAWSAGVAGLALALSVVALTAGHVTPPLPTVSGFQPVVVPQDAAAATRSTPPTRPTATEPILEGELSPIRHRGSSASTIRSAARAVVKPKPKPKPRPERHVRRQHSRPQPVRVPSVATARSYARSRIGATQFGCLDRLWTKESNWRPRALNPSSGAYGIPQALPGSKMATAGADWRYNPMTQVRWGLDYIRRAYGTACAAWSHSVKTDWY